MSEDTLNPPVLYARLADGSMVVGPLLRDVITIQALNGLLAGRTAGVTIEEYGDFYVNQSYKFADAMLARRRR